MPTPDRFREDYDPEPDFDRPTRSEAERDLMDESTLECVYCEHPIEKNEDGTWIHSESGRAPCPKSIAKTGVATPKETND